MNKNIMLPPNLEKDVTIFVSARTLLPVFVIPLPNEMFLVSMFEDETIKGNKQFIARKLEIGEWVPYKRGTPMLRNGSPLHIISVFEEDDQFKVLTKLLCPEKTERRLRGILSPYLLLTLSDQEYAINNVFMYSKSGKASLYIAPLHLPVQLKLRNPGVSFFLTVGSIRTVNHTEAAEYAVNALL